MDDDESTFNQLFLKLENSTSNYNSQNSQSQDDDAIYNNYQYDSYPVQISRLPRTTSEENRGSALVDTDTQDFLSLVQSGSGSQLQNNNNNNNENNIQAIPYLNPVIGLTTGVLINPVSRVPSVLVPGNYTYSFNLPGSSPSPSPYITDSDVMGSGSPASTATSPCPIEEQTPLTFHNISKRSYNSNIQTSKSYRTITSTASTPVESPFSDLVDLSLPYDPSNYISTNADLNLNSGEIQRPNTRNVPISMGASSSSSLSSSTSSETTLNTHKKNRCFKKKQKKSFKCEICDKYLTRKDSLKNHITSVHQGLKPHKCSFPECSNKKYSTSSDLRRHVRETHTNNKYYLCAGVDSHGRPWGCGKSFRRCYQMTTHWKSKRSKSKCGVPADFDYIPTAYYNNK